MISIYKFILVLYRRLYPESSLKFGHASLVPSVRSRVDGGIKVFSGGIVFCRHLIEWQIQDVGNRVSTSSTRLLDAAARPSRVYLACNAGKLMDRL